MNRFIYCHRCDKLKWEGNGPVRGGRVFAEVCDECLAKPPVSTSPPLSDAGNNGQSGKPATATTVHPDIQASRQEVYGDPRENHDGIAMAWVGLLQPHADKIARGEPIPAWTVALLLASLKINRMRRVFKQDNYDDLAVYASFAEKWQREESPLPTTPADNVQGSGSK